MHKTLTQKGLSGRSAGRTLLAFSLVTSLAAFGCTTNRTPGNGEPLRSGPGVGPVAPTSGVTSGSSSGGTVTYQPMMSSSQHLDPLPGVTTRAKRLPLSPDEAAAIMADNQFGRGARVLGPVNPASSGHRYVSDTASPFDRRGTGIITVNSSINSVGQAPGIVSTGVAPVATAVSGITGASTIAGTGTGTTVATPAGTPLTPTTAAIPLTAGAFAAGPTATISTPAVSTGAAGTGTLTPTVSSSFVPAPTTATSGAVLNPVRIVQNANGTVTVTNSSGGTQKK